MLTGVLHGLCRRALLLMMETWTQVLNSTVQEREGKRGEIIRSRVVIGLRAFRGPKNQTPGSKA